MVLMTPRQAEICALRHNGYTRRQIADMTGLAFATVRQTIRRSRRRLEANGLKLPEVPLEPRIRARVRTIQASDRLAMN